MYSCESTESKKIKFYVHGKSIIVDWDENLYIDRIFETEHYMDIELMHNNPKYYLRHNISIGDLDRLWLSDSRVYPSSDISDSLYYNFYMIDTENGVFSFERITNDKNSYLLLEYSIYGNLSFVQSHIKVNDSLDMVLRSTFSTDKMRYKEEILKEHKFVFKSMIAN